MTSRTDSNPMTHDIDRPPKHFILEDSLSKDGRSWVFEAPHKVVIARNPDELTAAFLELEDLRQKGFYLAGFMSYEAGYAFEPSLVSLAHEEPAHPLLWFTAYERARNASKQELDDFFAAKDTPYQLSPVNPRIARETYLARVETILEYIRAGDIYQANLTYQSDLELAGHPSDLFAALRQTQPVSFGAYIEWEDWSLLSCSPELFFALQDGQITSRPMKGTAPRQFTPERDQEEITILKSDPKQRSENLMILDLIRNDLSRLCTPGSVQVPSSFDVETYKTVHQMTSTVVGTMRENVSLSDLFRALFPCGSITGAPKIRAMEIIRELEPSPRGPYTGAIGMIAPDGSAQFNVAIRTLSLSKKAEGQWSGSIGVGGGIVQDSVPALEWQECQQKLKFLELAHEDPATHSFDLIETIKWSRREGFHLAERHFDRLQSSADYFAYPVSRQSFNAALEKATENLKDNAYIIRCLLSEDGSFQVTSKVLAATGESYWNFTLCEKPVAKDNLYLYHKTTNRTFYDQTYARAHVESGVQEVLFQNEEGILTEGSRSNFFIEKDGILYTSPIECGLLDGTLRRELLENKERAVIERPLTLDDLRQADQLYFGNSVRGLMPAFLLPALATEAGE
jgi:para-aminobenzoate synthetase/4-amino-4-deoxychorismate lyase